MRTAEFYLKRANSEKNCAVIVRDTFYGCCNGVYRDYLVKETLSPETAELYAKSEVVNTLEHRAYLHRPSVLVYSRYDSMFCEWALNNSIEHRIVVAVLGDVHRNYYICEEKDYKEFLAMLNRSEHD